MRQPLDSPAAAIWTLSVHGCRKAEQYEELRTALAGHLVGAGLAASVAPPGQPGDLSLDVQVTRMRTVSPTARAIIGTFAGRNAVVSRETLHDRTGAVLRSFEAEGDPAAHPLSGETTLVDAYRQFASKTVTALR